MIVLRFVVLVVLALVGCAQVESQKAPKEKPFPTQQEIQQDLFKRQHSVECSELYYKIHKRMAADIAAGKPVQEVNTEGPDEQRLQKNCDIKPEKIEVKQAVGCENGNWSSSGGYGGDTLSGPNGRTYWLNNMNDAKTAPPLSWTHYYLITYWRFLNANDEVDHVLTAKDMGKCL